MTDEIRKNGRRRRKPAAKGMTAPTPSLLPLLPTALALLLALLAATAATPAQAALSSSPLTSWSLASGSAVDGLRAWVAESVASLFKSPADAPSPPSPSQMTFKLDMAIHHSTHPDYLGKSAIYDYRREDVGVENAAHRQRHTYGGVETQRQTLTQLRDPRAYLEKRRDILDRGRVQVQLSGDRPHYNTFVAELDYYHTLLDWDEDEDVLIPDVTKRSTLLALARMSSAAYEAPPDPPTWKPTPGFEDWNVSDSFGWIEDGIRGHVFSSGPDDDIVVVALKGTSAALFPGGDDTARRDKLNDNLLFSCCCARVSWTWSPVCPCPFSGSKCSQPCLERSLLHQSVYYPLITDLYNNISYHYPNSQIWVTGHSLGGALASLIGYTFGVPGITYEAPAERMAAKRLHLPMPPGSERRRDGSGREDGGDKNSQPPESARNAKYTPPNLPITHVFHNADPIPMGTCTGQTSLCGSAGYAMESVCHAGQVVVYNTTGLLGWSSNIATHRIANLVDDLLTEHWGDRVRKEWKRVHQSARAATPALSSSWWPWKGSKGHDDGDDGMPDWLVELGETPAVTDQNDCRDCGDWEFVDEDKRK